MGNARCIYEEEIRQLALEHALAVYPKMLDHPSDKGLDDYIRNVRKLTDSFVSILNTAGKVSCDSEDSS